MRVADRRRIHDFVQHNLSDRGCIGSIIDHNDAVAVARDRLAIDAHTNHAQLIGCVGLGKATLQVVKLVQFSG